MITEKFAVIFDMDGLMFDTERIAIEAWQRAGRMYGYDMPEALILQSVGRNVEDTQLLFEQALGATFDFCGVRALRVQYAADIITQRGVPIKNGLMELLDMLTNVSAPKAIATSTERMRAETLLKSANVRERFEVVVCGDEVQHGKPSPDIFLLAASKLHIAPSRCFVLEDSESGIRAAVNAGMRPIMIPDLKPPTPELHHLAERIFPDLHHVASYFSKILVNS